MKFNYFLRKRVLLAFILATYAVSNSVTIQAHEKAPENKSIANFQTKRTNNPLLLPVIMVKNEESVIGKTLQPFVDAGIKDFFIYDTGSTDKTVSVTENYFKDNKISNFVIKQEPFIDFCTSRNRALTLAQQAFPNACFIVMPDAEWYLRNAAILVQFCKEHQDENVDIYGMRIINTSHLDYMNQRLFKCGGNGKFEGAVHEYAVGREGQSVPLDVYFEWAPTPQGMEKSRERWQRDRDILLREYFKNPDDPRTVFYLAQTYECLAELDNARVWYDKRVTMQGFDEERFVAHCRLARIYERLGNWDKALELDLKAFSERPHRAESLIHVAQHYYGTNDQALCYLFARQAADMPYPRQDILFIQKDLYDFTRHDLLGVGAWYFGDLPRGKQAVLAALESHPYDQHLLKNLALYIRREKEVSKKAPESTILNLHFGTPDPGGIESHLVMFNKIFNANGLATKVLTSSHASFVVNTLNQRGNPYGTPCATFKHNDFIPRTGDIIEQDPTIVICNWIGQLAATLKVREFMPVKIFYVQHNYFVDFTPEEMQQLNQVDGIVAVSPMVTKHFNNLSKQGILKVPVIKNIAPFFDDHKFLAFTPQRTKKEFLAQEHGLIFEDNYPIITMIGNMYYYKNQDLLIRAADILAKHRNKKFHILLAGDGPDLQAHKNTVQRLGLEKQIHFLGKVLNTPELLYHADIHALASSNESFGLVHVEAALMKKPFIGATKTGIESQIQNGVNGFVFENNNVLDLANKLEFLLDNPTQLSRMGENAYKFVRQEFSAETTFKKWQEFLAQAL